MRLQRAQTPHRGEAVAGETFFGRDVFRAGRFSGGTLAPRDAFRAQHKTYLR